MTYLILVECKNPLDAEILKQANNQNKEFFNKEEADEAVKKMNDYYGEGYSRVVAV